MKIEGELVSERFFRKMGFGAVPEWGILFSSGTILLFEYSTADNCRRSKLMKQKFYQYQDSLKSIEEYFDARAIVLFVLDVAMHAVQSFVQQDEAFYFVDLDSFMDVEEGKQLKAPVYIWGGDGKRYPLTLS